MRCLVTSMTPTAPKAYHSSSCCHRHHTFGEARHLRLSRGMLSIIETKQQNTTYSLQNHKSNKNGELFFIRLVGPSNSILVLNQKLLANAWHEALADP